MDKEPADAAGTRVEVLVAAPDGKVDVPRVERERYVRDGVSEVPPGDGADRVGGRGDALDREGLAGVVLHAGQEHEGQRVAFACAATESATGSEGKRRTDV